jgi:NADP-dependent 3-hydroxy acid dehydrogenase YdfG
MKRILLTWASSGLGLELAKLFHEKWCEVIALGRHKPEIDIPYISLDLTSGESIQQAIQEIKMKYSDFDCLLHCAGNGNVEPFDQIQFDEAESIFKLDVIWPITLTSWLFDLIKKNEADIIIIWATLWRKAYQYMTVYSCAKRGERWFVENLQVELKWTKSRVIGIYPWGMDTESNTGKNWRDIQMTKITGKENKSTMINPSEVAKIIFNLYSLPKNIEISEIVINRK